MDECENCTHDKDDHFIVGCIEKDEITGEECGCLEFREVNQRSNKNG